MAADAWTLHDKAKEYIGDGTIDLDNDSFKLALFTNASNVDTTSIEAYGTPTNEVGTTNTGYTTGGVALTGVTWTESSGTVTFDAVDLTDAWTAGSAGLTCRKACIYDTTATNTILCSTVLENGGTDIDVTDGNTLSITFPAGGIFQAS